MFEHVYIKENKDGYEDWLKSEEGVYDKDDLDTYTVLDSQSLLGTINDPETIPLASVLSVEAPSGCTVMPLKVLP